MKRFLRSRSASNVAALLSLACCFIAPVNAATWYVDGSATGANNGTSWQNAWTKLKSVTGLSAGDTVYISGGPSGSSQTYSVDINNTYPGQWLNVVNGVTYKIGQDSAHNGTAIFDGLWGSYWLVQGWNNVVISGDAGDGQRHFSTTNVWQAGNGNNWSNVRVSYVNFPAVGIGIDFNPGGTGVEIDHCYFQISNDTADHCSYAYFSGGTWDACSFHDNTVYVPYSSGGLGADGLQWNGSGYSIYNNTIISYYSSSYSGNQHADGWQSTGAGASYIKVYGNKFVDFGNYACYPEPYLGDYSHMRIYNNVAILTYGNATQGIVVSGNCNDVIMANNTVDGYAYPCVFRNSGSAVNCYCYNNVSVNGTTNMIEAGITAANNASLTAAQGAADFVSYVANSSSNDYHLKAAATALIGQGTNVSSYFTTDKDGNARPASGPWDIGAYIAGASAPRVSPSNAITAILIP